MQEENMKKGEEKTMWEREICSLKWEKEEKKWTVYVPDGNESRPLYSMQWNEEKKDEKWIVYLNINEFSLEWEKKEWTVNKNDNTKQNKEWPEIGSMKWNKDSNKKGGKWTYYICDKPDKTSLKMPSKFSAIMNFISDNYKEHRSNRDNVPDEDLPCVWTLRERESQKIIQVGSSSSLNNMWENDIKKDLVAFFSESGGYSELRTTCQKEDTYQLTFYEVDIRAYILHIEALCNKDIYNKDIIKPIEPIWSFLMSDNAGELNKYIKESYYYVLAAHVEGKLGYDSKMADNQGIASMYNKSTLDGYFYDYFAEIN
jgi:hypothetical protein